MEKLINVFINVFTQHRSLSEAEASNHENEFPSASLRERVQSLITNKKTVSLGFLIMLMIGCLPVFAYTDSLTISIDTYFSVLKGDFKACAASSLVKSRQVKHINTYFIKTLKKRQPLFSLSMTTSKGRTLSEIVRGEKPVRTKKDVSKQFWFVQVRKSLKEYDGLVKEDNGRYYLLWSVPVLHKAVKGVPKFDGVVVAKIDLWDCFQKIAETTKKPFCVRLNDMTLYTHLWENQRIYLEDSLLVPGAVTISVRYQKNGVSAVASQEPESSSVLSRKDSAQNNLASIQGFDKNSPKPAKPKVSKTNVPIVIGLIVLIIIITIILIMQLIGKIRHLVLMRSIDKQDR